MDTNFARITEPPHLHVAHATTQQFFSFGYGIGESGVTVRFLRGKRMRTCDALFAEIAAALQFPHYFGANWAALDECLCDLEWLPGNGYLFMFDDAHLIGSEEADRALQPLFKILTDAGSYWGRPIKAEGARNRPAKPFHSVFQCDGSHRIEARLKNATAAFGAI
jgi:Barstar (barnase inhibitor)